MKRIHIVFMFYQVLVQIPHAIERWLESRNSHFVELVKMRNELVPVRTYLESIRLEPRFIETRMLV